MRGEKIDSTKMAEILIEAVSKVLEDKITGKSVRRKAFVYS